MRTRGFLLAGMALLIGLGVLWFRTNFEKRMVQETVGASGEARLRQYLAAERFAQRMGWKATELRSLPELGSLPAGGTLIMPDRRQALTRERVAELVAWAERGGHLIIDAEYLGVPDPLLDALGVQRSDAPPMVKPVTVLLPQTGRALSVSIPVAMKLVTGEGDLRLRVGEQLISFGWGRGVVTVATTLGFAQNRSIGELDHAEFLWTLLTITPSRELLVYWAPAKLSLWGFLKENAAPALAGFALLLFLWIWNIVPRFGPVAPDAPPGRRRLLDHLRASGRYYWVKGLRSRLVVAARDAALRRIARVQPDFAVVPATERAQRVAALTGVSKEEAHRFIHSGGAMRGADFIKLTQQAQRVHSALEKGAKQ